MTRVNIGETTLFSEGHAAYNLEGSDVVCASVSILCWQLAQEVLNAEENGKLQEKPTINLKSGVVDIKCRPQKAYKEEIKRLFSYAKTGFLLLEQKYPKNVVVGGVTPAKTFDIE